MLTEPGPLRGPWGQTGARVCPLVLPMPFSSVLFGRCAHLPPHLCRGVNREPCGCEATCPYVRSFSRARGETQRQGGEGAPCVCIVNTNPKQHPYTHSPTDVKYKKKKKKKKQTRNTQTTRHERSSPGKENASWACSEDPGLRARCSASPERKTGVPMVTSLVKDPKLCLWGCGFNPWPCSVG